MFKTIIALATPPMKSALAIIRVSGDDCFEIVSKVFSKDLTNINKRTALVGEILDNGKVIDEVVLIAYKGPKSFTGEDLVEIICHGSMLIANQIMKLLLSKGATLATNGEYSERAFVNNRIDLVQAEAINDVINSISNEAKELSLLSLKGETSNLLLPIKTKLADLLALIEVNIDFPEYEDIEIANKDKVVTYVDDITTSIKDLISDGEKGQLVKEGIKVAIVGKPNVGKSSLLNALLGENKAIVTDVAGTTRDIVEGDVNLNGIVLHLLDTAGIRNSSNIVESIGINKSKETINNADLVLVVLDSSNELTDEDKEILKLTENSNRIIVNNKADISNKNLNGISVSALNNDISNLKDAIYEKFGISDKVFKTPSLNNTRQLGLLRNANESLLKAKEDALNDLSIDLVAVSLKDAYDSILQILGEDNSVDFSKEIFSRFCVGK